MLHGLFLASLIGSVVRIIKEANAPVIPAENWANKELQHEDLMNGMSMEEILRNVEKGRYKLTGSPTEPHRDPVSGKIIIENCKLYREDLSKYGAVQAQKWVREGKYNLTPEENEKEKARIKAEIEEICRLRRKYRY